MPGYRPLPDNLVGEAAERARAAELLELGGHRDEATRMLEEALRISLERSPEMPGWLAGRLAALYRTLRRYDDEVALLEQYRESQTSEPQRVRYEARLSKARAIATQKKKRSSGALESVHRLVTDRPRRKPLNGRLFFDDAADTTSR